MPVKGGGGYSVPDWGGRTLFSSLWKPHRIPSRHIWLLK